MRSVSTGNPSLTRHPCKSLQRPDRLRDTAGTVQPPSARDQTTDQVGNDQAITRGYLQDPNEPLPRTFLAILGTESHGRNNKEHNYPRTHDYIAS